MNNEEIKRIRLHDCGGVVGEVIITVKSKKTMSFSFNVMYLMLSTVLTFGKYSVKVG